MKKLTLIRHAKSSWRFSGLPDYDRPLNKCGRHDAPMMGARLAARGFAPHHIISSSALRALRTAEAIATAIDLSPYCLHVVPLIYRADAHQLMTLIHRFDPNDDWVAIVGHNPEMTNLVRQLSGQYIDNVPTCGVAEFHYAIDQWHQINNGKTKPQSFDFDYPTATANP